MISSISAHRFLARFRADHESLHKSELHTFQNLISDSDLHKCEIIRWFLQRKVEVPMSAYSHQLLIAFLEQQRYLLLLKIINEHMHIRGQSRMAAKRARCHGRVCGRAASLVGCVRIAVVSAVAVSMLTG